MGDGRPPEGSVLLGVGARREEGAAAAQAVQHPGEGSAELGGHQAVDDGVARAVDVDEEAHEVHDVHHDLRVQSGGPARQPSQR